MSGRREGGAGRRSTVRDAEELFLFLQLDGQPLQAFVQAVPAGGTGSLDVPVSVAQGVEPQLIGEFSGCHRVWEILQKKNKRDPMNERMKMYRNTHTQHLE